MIIREYITDQQLSKFFAGSILVLILLYLSLRSFIVFLDGIDAGDRLLEQEARLDSLLEQKRQLVLEEQGLRARNGAWSKKLSRIQTHADSLGLSVSEFKRQQTTSHGSLNQTWYQMKVEGDFESALAYLDLLENLPFAAPLSFLNMQANKERTAIEFSMEFTLLGIHE